MDDLEFLRYGSTDDEWDAKRAQRIMEELGERPPIEEVHRHDADRARVVAWLHLEDREEAGDAYVREVWKSVDVGPWYHGPESLSRSVPVTARDAALLIEPAPIQWTG